MCLGVQHYTLFSLFKLVQDEEQVSKCVTFLARVKCLLSVYSVGITLYIDKKLGCFSYLLVVTCKLLASLLIVCGRTFVCSDSANSTKKTLKYKLIKSHITICCYFHVYLTVLSSKTSSIHFPKNSL